MQLLKKGGFGFGWCALKKAETTAIEAANRTDRDPLGKMGNDHYQILLGIQAPTNS